MMKITRRTFSLSLAAAGAAYFVGCGGSEQLGEVRVPEDADDIANLFRRFTEPAFGFEEAKAGLGLIGEPIVTERFNEKRYEFRDQSERLRSAELTMRDNRTGSQPSNDLRLTEVLMHFRRTIDVSLNRLEHHLGAGKGIDTMGGVGMLSVPAVRSFTNIVPGTNIDSTSMRSRFPTMYEFALEAATLKVYCSPAESNVKSVGTLRLTRSVR